MTQQFTTSHQTPVAQASQKKTGGVIEENEIPVYVIDIDRALNSWVGDRNQVIAGIEAAMADANAFGQNNPVKLLINGQSQIIGDEGQVTRITTMDQLYNLVQNPPEHAIIVNAHGEVVPIPQEYITRMSITYPLDGQHITKGDIIFTNAWAKEVALYSEGNLGIESCFRRIRPQGGQWGNWQLMTYFEEKWEKIWDTSNCIENHWYDLQVKATSYSGVEVYHTRSVFIEAPPPEDPPEDPPDPPPGGGCPYLYFWNGSIYTVENNLLQASETTGGDVIDHYLLQHTPIARDGLYYFVVGEYEAEHDYFDTLRLITVDHAPDVNVAVTQDGRLLTYCNPTPPPYMIDNCGNDVSTTLSAIDGDWFEGYDGDFLHLKLQEVPSWRPVKLMLYADAVMKDSIHIDLLDRSGCWREVEVIHTRTNWAMEIVDLTPYRQWTCEPMEVRLRFTANHKLDFVGVDTSYQEPLVVRPAPLVAALNWDETDIENLLSSPNGNYAELSPGRKFLVKFQPAPVHPVFSARDFLMVAEGRYEQTELHHQWTAPMAVTIEWEADPAKPDWQLWFNKISDSCRTSGLIWANVAGVSHYYVSNKDYWSTDITCGGTIPAVTGIKVFVDDTTIVITSEQQGLVKFNSGVIGKPGFSSYGFSTTYNLPEYDSIQGSRFLTGSNLYIECGGYAGEGNSLFCTAAFTMQGLNPGIFIYSGLDSDANGDGNPNTSDDDDLKGYIATVLAIEEAKSQIGFWSDQIYYEGNNPDGGYLSAVTGITIVPGSWRWEEYRPDSLVYYALDLRVSVKAHYPFYHQYVGGAWVALSVVDYYFVSGANSVKFNLIAGLSGVERSPDEDPDFMDDLWWQMSSALAGKMNDIFGLLYGSIPTIIDFFTPEDDFNQYFCAEGVRIRNCDPGVKDDWGEADLFVTIYFKRPTTAGNHEHWFAATVNTWVEDYEIPTIGWKRAGAVHQNIEIGFQVHWTD